MKAMSTLVVLVFLALASARHTQQEEDMPPYCTEVEFIKENYIPNQEIQYLFGYIEDKQPEMLRNLFCTSPIEVTYAIARACDWTTAPLVSFTLDNKKLHVIRQDPAKKFAGRAVVSMYQKFFRR